MIATFSLILLFFFFYSDEELEFLSFKGAKRVGAMMQEYLVPEEAAGTRIDKFLADACPDLSVPFAETSEEQRDSRRKSG